MPALPIEPSNGHIPGSEKITGDNVGVTNHGGDIIKNVEIVPVFYGSQWKEAPLDDHVRRNTAFLKQFVRGPSMKALEEYGVGLGSCDNAIIIDQKDESIGKELYNSQIQSLLAQDLTEGSISHKPNANTLYMLSFEPDVDITFTNYNGKPPRNQTSIKNFFGYHSTIPPGTDGSQIANNVAYAVIITPPPQSILTNFPSLDWSKVASHEIYEALTDKFVNRPPSFPAQGAWYRDVDTEIGDICTQNIVKWKDYNIQKFWSNKESDCIDGFSLTRNGQAAIGIGAATAALFMGIAGYELAKRCDNSLARGFVNTVNKCRPQTLWSSVSNFVGKKIGAGLRKRIANLRENANPLNEAIDEEKGSCVREIKESELDFPTKPLPTHARDSDHIRKTIREGKHKISSRFAPICRS